MRRPWLHFLLLGGLLHAGVALGPWAADDTPVRLDAADIRRLAAELEAETGRPPERAALEARVRAAVDEEILVQEALRRGLDRDDPVIRRRLVQNVGFTGAEDGDADTAYATALSLGMDRSDPVVRRRLVQQMRFALEASVDPDPDDGVLAARLAADGDRYALPARTRFRQVAFGHDARGDAAEPAARAALAALESDARRRPEPPVAGDPLLLPGAQPLQSASEVARRFGPAFAAALAGLPQGQWSGPVRSPYAWHLVYVEDRTPVRVPRLSEVRARVRGDWLAERRAEALQAGIEVLRARTQIEVIWPEAVEGADPRVPAQPSP